MLSLQTLVTLVQNMAAAAQSAASQALDFTVGSVWTALMQAVAGVQLWLQYLVLGVLQQSSLTLCTGAQVDAWLAQFPLFGGRLPGAYASGNVTFGRFTTVSSALIAAGSFVRTADGVQTYVVSTDTTNALWSQSQNGYLIPAGTATGIVPVQAQTIGISGNVAANTITLVVGSVPGIDYVNNGSAFANGENAESDQAVKTRFQMWQANLAEGTYGAVQVAVESVGANLTMTIEPNQTTNGTFTPGSFVVTIDDGSGATPSSTVQTVAAAVNGVRPIGSTAYVQAATALLADISMTITVGSGYSTSAAQAAVNAALVAYIGSLGVGVTMRYSILSKLAYDAYAGVTNVTLVTLNSGTSDLVPTQFQVVRAGTIAVNV